MARPAILDAYRPTAAEEALAGDLTGLRVVTAWSDARAPAESAVRDAIAREPAVDTTDLRLVIHGQTIAIEGSIAGIHDRDLLIGALERVPGVEQVVVRTPRIRPA